MKFSEWCDQYARELHIALFCVQIIVLIWELWIIFYVI